MDRFYQPKKPKLNLFTETRHSKDIYFVQKPVSLCKIKNALLEVFRQPQHLVHGSSKQQTCRKHLLYLNNFISFLFLLYSPRDNVFVIDSKSHRRALSVNWKSPGFLSVSVVSLYCMVFWTTKLCITVTCLDLMRKGSHAASALAHAAQHGLVT